MDTKTKEEQVALRIESDLLEAWPKQYFDIKVGSDEVTVMWVHGPSVVKVDEIIGSYTHLGKEDADAPSVATVNLARGVDRDIMKALFYDIKKAWASVTILEQMTDEFDRVFNRSPLEYVRRQLDNVDLFTCESCEKGLKCECDTEDGE